MHTSHRFGCVAGIVAALMLATGCSGGGGGGGTGNGGPQINEGPIACGQAYSGSLPRSAGNPPMFADGRGVRQVNITGLGGGLGAIEIRVTSSSKDLNLFLGLARVWAAPVFADQLMGLKS